MDEKALYQISYGLYIVSAQAGDQASGCVVNTLTQVTSRPVQLAVTVNRENLTCQLIEQAGRFTAVALDQSADLPYIGRYGFRSGRDIEKFTGENFARDGAGMPYPTEHACARYSCRVVQSIDLGTHRMFIGEAQEAEILGEGTPLTYGYYRSVIKGGTPKTAPSYQEKK